MVEEVTALRAALVSDSNAAWDPLVSSETSEELSSLAELDLVAIDDVEVFDYGSVEGTLIERLDAAAEAVGGIDESRLGAGSHRPVGCGRIGTGAAQVRRRTLGHDG